jgi:hypothetical protein
MTQSLQPNNPVERNEQQVSKRSIMTVKQFLAGERVCSPQIVYGLAHLAWQEERPFAVIEDCMLGPYCRIRHRQTVVSVHAPIDEHLVYFHFGLNPTVTF